MKVKVAKASGVVLDWLVAHALGISHDIASFIGDDDKVYELYLSSQADKYRKQWLPSTDWTQGGPIIEQLRSYSAYRLLIESDGDNVHVLSWPSKHVHFSGYGPTTLIASMRCYATSRLGEEVEVPNELLET